MSLLQPASEVVTLFDKVLVLHEGHMVFQGASTAVANYFELELRFARPPGVGVADFVLACVDSSTKLPEDDAKKSPEFETLSLLSASSPTNPSSSTFPRPTSTKSLVSAFLSSSHGRNLALSLPSSAPSPANSLSSSWTEYEQSPFHTFALFSSFLLLAHQDFILTCRDTSLLFTRLFNSLLLGIVIGCLYFQIGTSASNSTVSGALYEVVLAVAFQTTALIPFYFNARPLFYKQKEAGFFVCFPALLASTLVSIPFVLINSLVFGSIMYFMTAFYDGAGGKEGGREGAGEWIEHYGIFLLNLIATGVAMVAFFRGMAYMCPSITVTMALAGLFVLIFLLFSGFIIPRTVIPESFGWIIWINPVFNCYQGKSKDFPIPCHVIFLFFFKTPP